MVYKSLKIIPKTITTDCHRDIFFSLTFQIDENY